MPETRNYVVQHSSGSGNVCLFEQSTKFGGNGHSSTTALAGKNTPSTRRPPLPLYLSSSLPSVLEHKLLQACD